MNTQGTSKKCNFDINFYPHLIYTNCTFAL